MPVRSCGPGRFGTARAGRRPLHRACSPGRRTWHPVDSAVPPDACRSGRQCPAGFSDPLAVPAQLLQEGVGGGRGPVHRLGAGHDAQPAGGVLQVPARLAGGPQVMAEAGRCEAGQHGTRFPLCRQQHSDNPAREAGRLTGPGDSRLPPRGHRMHLPAAVARRGRAAAQAVIASAGRCPCAHRPRGS